MRPASKREKIYFQNWEEKKKNKFRFCLIRGTLYWGIPTGLTISLVTPLLNSEPYRIVEIALSTIIFGITGLGYGYWELKFKDKRYRQIIDQL